MAATQTDSPTSPVHPPINEFEYVINFRVEPRDGGSVLVVVNQRVRLESARIAPIGEPTEVVRPL